MKKGRRSSRRASKRSDVALTTKDLAWRQTTIARAMNVAVRRMQERVIKIMIDRGYDDIRLAHVNLTRNLDIEGNPITELANRASMTKQAMGELVDQCERIKLVERTPDPHDRRVWIVKFTDHGLTWLADLKKAVDQVEGEMIDIIGKGAFESLRDFIDAYNRADLPD